MTTTAPISSEEDPIVVELSLDDWLRAIEGKPLTLGDILERARIESGLDDEDMPGIPSMQRFSHQGVEWRVGKEPPGDAMRGYIIATIFVGDQADRQNDHRPGDVRIYTIPKHPTSSDGRPNPYCRYTLNRGDGSLTQGEMGLKLFVEEVGYELTRMGVVLDILDDDDEEEDDDEDAKICAACSTENDVDAKRCKECGAVFPVASA